MQEIEGEGKVEILQKITDERTGVKNRLKLREKLVTELRQSS
jgi:hypothetical protein